MPGDWVNFGLTAGGASAALAGLLFVAVSVNLTRITPHRALRARAAETLALLLTPLLISLVLTIPAQRPWHVGLEVVATAGLVGGLWFILGRRDEDSGSSPEALLARQIHRFSPTLTTTLLLLIGGGSLIAGGGGGYYWLVPAVLTSFLGGVTNAWLLLIRIGDQG
jgi:modulator of FtsH protease